MGLAVVAVSVLVGVTVGVVAGYFGRRWDSVLMRITDVFLAFPLIIGALLITTVFDSRGILILVAALALFSWATVSRLMRSTALVAREAEYVEAARRGGEQLAHPHDTSFPTALRPFSVYAAVSIPAAIVAEAALTFLGVGLKPGAGLGPDGGGRAEVLRLQGLPLALPIAGARVYSRSASCSSRTACDALDPKLRGSR